MKRYEKVRRRAPGEKQISASRVGSGEVHGSSGNAATQEIWLKIFSQSQFNFGGILRQFTRKC